MPFFTLSRQKNTGITVFSLKDNLAIIEELKSFFNLYGEI